MQVAVEAEARTGEVLECATAFFEDYLWKSGVCATVRGGLERNGLTEAALRDFRVGYAPVGPGELLRHLGSRGYSEEDIQGAGIATRSARSHFHARFRSRVMFPVTDREGSVLGFAGLATHLGPSWPLWLTSPDRGLYVRSDAIFGLQQATSAIARSGRALVLADCVEVLEAHQRGVTEAVAIHSSQVGVEQLEQLSAGLAGGADGLELIMGESLKGRRRREPTPLRSLPEPASAEGRASTSDDDPAPDLGRPLTRRERVVPALAAAAIGIGIPVAWLLSIDPASRPKGGTSDGLSVTLVGIGATYLVLAVLSGFVSASVVSRSPGRRMRLPWIYGSTEWQPLAWTHHFVERILIAAAVITSAICLILLSTLGGFFG